MTQNPKPSIPRIKRNRKIARPVRLDILEAATALPGKATQLLIGIWLMVTIQQSPTVRLSRATMSRVHVSRFGATVALRRLEAAGIIKAWRLPGRSPLVTILEPGTTQPLKLEPPEVMGRRVL